MSLVGPRPEQIDLVERYTPAQRFRLEAKPGITGPMQVYGRGELTFDERLAVEREYIENLSLTRDLRILALTVGHGSQRPRRVLNPRCVRCGFSSGVGTTLPSRRRWGRSPALGGDHARSRTRRRGDRSPPALSAGALPRSGSSPIANGERASRSRACRSGSATRRRFERAREEATYAASVAAAAACLVPRPDVAVVVSPSFAALAPLLARPRLRRIPWVLWLQDILPDAAVTTGLVRKGSPLGAARRLERAAYRSADRIVVISEAFSAICSRKACRPEKIEVIYNPATRGFVERAGADSDGPLRILAMGNIGYSQGLPELVRAFEASDLREDEVRLVITGSGELADRVRAEIRTRRVEFLGLVSDADARCRTRPSRARARQPAADLVEFNLPSKLMTFVGRGTPDPRVRPGGQRGGADRERVRSRVGRRRSATPGRRAARFARRRWKERERRAGPPLALARDTFSVERLARSFEELLPELA